MQKHMTLGVLVFLGAVAVCVAQTDCTFGSYDLSSIGTQSLSIPQTYKGQTTTHTWVFNFCSPANQPPPNTATACSGAGYVSEYSAVTQPKCEMYWPTQTGSSSSYEYVQLNYTGGQSMNPLWTAVVNLNCDSGADALSSAGPVAITATPGTNVLQFVFSLTSRAVCAPTPPACLVGGYDLSSLGTQLLTIPQLYQGSTTSHIWMFNFCQPVIVGPPNAVGLCSTAGYVAEYDPSVPVACEMFWPTQTAATPTATGVQIQYSGSSAINPGWTAVVNLTCNSSATSPTLVSSGVVNVVGSNPNELQFLFSLATNAVCTSSPAPVLPPFFQGSFTEYTAYEDTMGPPYVNGVPPAPLVASRGRVYYDWTLKNMIEVREDYCVNIFPEGGHHFPCVFQNVNGTSYLITYNRSALLPPCCVFAKPWYPPQPAFLRENVTAMLSGVAPWNAGTADWYKIPSIAPPTGPFFYSFNSSIPVTEEQVYTSFAFPGMTGWVQQVFSGISYTQPDASVWDLPSICLPTESLPTCDFFGSHSGSGGSGSN